MAVMHNNIQKSFEVRMTIMVLSSDYLNIRQPSFTIFNIRKVHIQNIFNYGISQPIRRTFFPEKCDLNLTCVLCATGKYYFQTYSYKYPYIYHSTFLS